MPFTLAHPAAVLPLRSPLGRRAVFSALVIGAMAPDLPYFLGHPWPRSSTHTLASIAWFSVPTGWIGYLVFQLVLRRACWFALPDPLRARSSPESDLQPPLAVTLSLALGALTHVAWDSFTHASGTLVQAYPFLRELLFELCGYPVWSYKLLQHGSTAVGFTALGLALRGYVRGTSPEALPPASRAESRARIALQGALATLPAGFGVAFGLDRAAPGPGWVGLSWFLANTAVAGLTLAVAILAGFGVGLALRDRRRLRPQGAAQPGATR